MEKRKKMWKTYYLKFSLQLGDMMVEINPCGEILSLTFDRKESTVSYEGKTVISEHELNADFESEFLSTFPELVKETMRATVFQLNQYEQNELQEFDLKLSLVGSEFQKKVWNILLEIPYGETISYGEIARRLCRELDRKSMSAQAVGNAVGRNPIAILVPCHRVIGADGSLTGYAAGLEKKELLLKCENMRLNFVKKKQKDSKFLVETQENK